MGGSAVPETGVPAGSAGRAAVGRGRVPALVRHRARGTESAVCWSVVLPVILAVLVVLVVTRLRAADRKLGELLAEIDVPPPPDEDGPPRPEG